MNCVDFFLLFSPQCSFCPSQARLSSTHAATDRLSALVSLCAVTCVRSLFRLKFTMMGWSSLVGSIFGTFCHGHGSIVIVMGRSSALVSLCAVSFPTHSRLPFVWSTIGTFCRGAGPIFLCKVNTREILSRSWTDRPVLLRSVLRA